MTVFVVKKMLDAYGINDSDKCICGTYKCVVHCPACGSTQCYGSKRNNVEALLPGGLGKYPARAFRCKLCQNLFSEADCLTACNAKTRWRQKQDAELRTQKAIEHEPSGLAGEIIEAAKKYQRNKQASKELGPLELAKLDRDNKHKAPDDITAKLFDPPKIEDDDSTEDTTKES